MQKQCQFLLNRKKLNRMVIRLPETKAFKLRLEAARRNMSMNLYMNKIIDKVITAAGQEKRHGHQGAR